MCLRLPDVDPPAVAVAESDENAQRVRSKLRASGLAVPVQVVGRHAYNERVLRLVEALTRELPDPSRMSVTWEVLRNEGRPFLHPTKQYPEAAVSGIQCPRAVIEIGRRGETPARNLEWARRQVRALGRDLVAYEYDPRSTAA